MLGSVVLAVVFPVAAGQFIKTPASPPKDPRLAPLEVQAEGDEGVAEPKRVLVGASGVPPARTVLRNTDGLETAVVKPHGDCSGVPRRSTGNPGPGAVDWCLSITDHSQHAKVEGTVTGRRDPRAPSAMPTALALTVYHREGALPIVIPAIVIGLIATCLATLLVKRVKRGIVSALLDWTVSRNAAKNERERVAGLAELVAVLRELTSDREIRRLIKPVIKHGPARPPRADGARRARGELGELLDAEPVLPSNPLVKRAREEHAREDHARADFLDWDGSEVTHPAAQFVPAIGALRESWERLNRYEAEIDEKLVESCRIEPGRELAEAREMWLRTENDGDRHRLEAHVAEVDRAIVEKLARDACRKDRVEARGAEIRAAEAQHPERPAQLSWAMPASGELMRAPLELVLLGLAGMTVVFIAVVFAISAATIYFATYEPDKTFGGLESWTALAFAIIGAGLSGTVAGLLAPWQAAAEAEA